MPSVKELNKKEELLTPGHRLCAGCGASVVVRQVLLCADAPVIAANATGCLEIGTGIYPFTAWKMPWIHSAFENAAATAAGMEAMYQSLRKQGKIPQDKKIRFVAFGGDGGTYDIGLQSLSGALERGHDFLYVCYDNGAYMNTGIQRSSSTPFGADTTTSPAGKVIPGKKQFSKDLTAIVAAHNIPYLAQASPAFPRDLTDKATKAFKTEGPTFLNIMAPCPRGWRTEINMGIKIAKIAVETCFWPLYEVENGNYKLTYKPKEKRPLVEWLKPQGRFRHLFQPENAEVLEIAQRNVDERWEKILKLCGEKIDANS